MKERIKSILVSIISGGISAFITVYLLTITGYNKPCTCYKAERSLTTQSNIIELEEQQDNPYVYEATKMLAHTSMANIKNELHKDSCVKYPEYSIVGVFSEGLAIVQREVFGKYGYIDREGNVVISFQFKYASSFSDGRAIVQFDDGLYGGIDKFGNIIIQPEYNSIEPFLNGKAKAKKGYKEYIIDKYGKVLEEVKD